MLEVEEYNETKAFLIFSKKESISSEVGRSFLTFSERFLASFWAFFVTVSALASTSLAAF